MGVIGGKNQKYLIIIFGKKVIVKIKEIPQEIIRERNIPLFYYKVNGL